MSKCERSFLIYGKVFVKETQAGIPNLIVEALDKDLMFDDRLGLVATGDDGSFEIRYQRDDYQELFLDARPDIYLRIRKADGAVLHTTKERVRYEADRTERFDIAIPKTLISQEEPMKKLNYRITGRVDPDALPDIPATAGLKAYAVRDRKVIGSAPVAPDGEFSIEYRYAAFADGKARKALGAYLIIGPDLPEDSILRTGLSGAFIEAEAFEESNEVFYSKASDAILAGAFDKSRVFDMFERFCRTWRPCVQVLTCSSIASGLCYDEQDLKNARVRIYQVRKPLLCWVGYCPDQYEALVAEGDTDSSGRFQHEETTCTYRYIIPSYASLGYRVEVGQIIDGAFQSIYKDPEDAPRTLTSGLCEEIYIDRSEVVEPVRADGALTGDSFKLTRIGNVPVSYIEQSASSSLQGYADSSGATDSATLKVRDAAFCRKIKLFANIGSGLLTGSDTVKYYRLKYSYVSGGGTIESYIQVPFNNLRESTDIEAPTMGPYVTENMGPVAGPDGKKNVYAYSNPYDLAADAQWVYRGLIMAYSTNGLPLTHGKFTFTVEPLDNSMNPVTVVDADDLSCTIVVDNTSPSASIGDISGPYGQAPACGFLELDAATDYTACDGNTRKRLSGTVTVPYNVNDAQRHIWKVTVIADYGDVCDPNITMQTLNYTDTTVVPASQRPHWQGGSYSASSTGRSHGGVYLWDQCAHEFEVRVHKRVTNGELRYYWWDYSKHITVMEKAP